MRRRSLVICGNGASAVALLCAMARNGQSPLAITVAGAGAVPGRGVAYATANSNHLPAPIGAAYDAALRERIIDNPWTDWDVGPDDEILILGTGLTAVDAVISLSDRGHRGTVHLVSRRGLLPARHVENVRKVTLPPPYPNTALGLLRALRNRAGRAPDPADWQAL